METEMPLFHSVILAKYNDGTGTRQTFPFQKGEMGKKKGVTGPEEV